MILVPNPHLRRLALALLLFLVSVEEGLAKTAQPSPRQTVSADSPEQSLAASILAAQVSEIAGSKMISRAKKEKRISTTVRIAVVAATAYKNDPRQTLNLALELTAAAAAAAPSYAEVITNAVSFAPALAKIDGAPSQIRTTAFAAAKSPRTKHTTRMAAVRPVEPAPAAEESNPEPVTERATMAEADQPDNEPAPQPRTKHRPQPVDADDQEMPRTSHESKFVTDKNSNFVITATATVRRDDNLFLSGSYDATKPLSYSYDPTKPPNYTFDPTKPPSSTNIPLNIPLNFPKAADTIYSVAPGIELQYGQNSLSHGSLVFNEAFTRYANKTAPNANLGSGTADFGYDNGDLNLSAAAKYQQVYQNDRTTAGLSGQTIVRQDVFGITSTAEEHFTPKTSVSTGATYNQTLYKAAGLVNNQDVTVPLKVYYAVTPKVSLSTGVEYRHSQTDLAGSTGKELYYNLGARGDFTPKLSGEFSVGYRSREADNAPKENLLSFSGNFAYEVTAKTNASLNFSRDFTTDALGKSLKNATYGLKLSTSPTPQWQFSAGLTYQTVDYGLISYYTSSTNLQIVRNDDYWSGDFQATYLFSNSLSTAFDYTVRSNNSTAPLLAGAAFNDNMFSFMLNWKY
jgi:hypothetical protein